MRLIPYILVTFLIVSAVGYHFFTRYDDRVNYRVENMNNLIKARSAVWHCQHQLEDLKKECK